MKLRQPSAVKSDLSRDQQLHHQLWTQCPVLHLQLLITRSSPPQTEQLIMVVRRWASPPPPQQPSNRTQHTQQCASNVLVATCSPSPTPEMVSSEKSGREPNSLLPMLSTPRGMITSAYFFVCKTAMVVESVNGKSVCCSYRNLSAKMDGVSSSSVVS